MRGPGLLVVVRDRPVITVDSKHKINVGCYLYSSVINPASPPGPDQEGRVEGCLEL